MQKSILTISRNSILQNLRTEVLEQHGYHVTTAANDEDALRFVEAPNVFWLVLPCHSVPEASRILLAQEIKELRPTLPILMLYNRYDPTCAKVGMMRIPVKTQSSNLGDNAPCTRKEIICGLNSYFGTLLH
jgi:CheY-like chemotaxis protein